MVRFKRGVSLLLLSLCMFSQFALAETASDSNWLQQKQRIEALLQAIEQADLTFVRNGSEHNPQQAGEHLRMKLKRAQNSWFAPDKESWTAEMFIDKLASKSSLSGKPYQIRFANGEQVDSSIWLYQQLALYDQQQGAQ